LRTVENPRLLACPATWAGGVLSVGVSGRTLSGTPRPTGETLEFDYWGRSAAVEVVDGPWAGAFSDLLGRPVALTRVAQPGEVVYGASISVVTTSSLRLLAETVAHAVDAARFRSTLVIDTDELEPHVEDSWEGRELRMGSAIIRIQGAIDRCAVIDADPATGAPGSRLLRALAGYRLRDTSIDFGAYAEVVTPGVVSRGDLVTVEPA
jgi:uncharacterized protein YcbX